MNVHEDGRDEFAWMEIDGHFLAVEGGGEEVLMAPRRG